MCRSKNKQSGDVRAVGQDDEDDYVVIPYVVGSVDLKSDVAPKRTGLDIEECSVTFTIDTGTQVNVLCEQSGHHLSGTRSQTRRKLFT